MSKLFVIRSAGYGEPTSERRNAMPGINDDERRTILSVNSAATRAEGPRVLQIRGQDLSPKTPGPMLPAVLPGHESALSKGAFPALSLLKSVDPGDQQECRLWRACELCSFLEHRLDDYPDPRALSDEHIDAWSARGLDEGELPSNPAEEADFNRFWLISDGARIGTVALEIRDLGWGRENLWVSSLYVFPEARRQGHAARLMQILEKVRDDLGLDAIQLDADWLWQPAVRLYLKTGFWVVNWKRALSLARPRDLPRYHVEIEPARMDFFLVEHETPSISAYRRRNRLVWEEHPMPKSGEAEQSDLRFAATATFALWLAVAGWPLIRGYEEWSQRHRWSDIGMPEGLASKIMLFEAYARRCGYRIDTPRVPRLIDSADSPPARQP